MNRIYHKQSTIILSILGLLFLSVQAQSQIMTGGSFQLMQSVIANGGNKSTGGTFSVEGTIAQQTVVEQKHINHPFSINSGFWSSQRTPTSAGVTVRGRVLTVRRRGLSNVSIVLTGGSNSNGPLTTQTDVRGFFEFSNVEVGHAYILVVQKDNLIFRPSNEVFFLQGSLNNLTFYALP